MQYQPNPNSAAIAPTPAPIVPMRGERRRAIVLANLTTLGFYLILVALAKWLPAAHTGQFTRLPAITQVAVMLPIWLGAWMILLAQRSVIAHGEGAYAALLAFTQVRGMRFLGLTLGMIMFATLVVTLLAGVTTARDLILMTLATLTLIAIGLPDAPTHTYLPPEPSQPPATPSNGSRQLIVR